MQYFILNCSVFIDGEFSHIQKVGSAVPRNDPRVNTVQRVVKEQEMKKNPGKKIEVTVRLPYRNVTKDEYFAESGDFLEIE